MIEEEVSFSIIPFSSEIIGVDKNYVYLKEAFWTGKESDELNFSSQTDNIHPCVVKVLRKHYLIMINKWLDEKQGFCERYGHFCGVFGNFHVEDYKEVGKMNVLVDFELGYDENDEGNPIYKELPVFEVISFNEHCDMEHG